MSVKAMAFLVKGLRDFSVVDDPAAFELAWKKILGGSMRMRACPRIIFDSTSQVRILASEARFQSSIEAHGHFPYCRGHRFASFARVRCLALACKVMAGVDVGQGLLRAEPSRRQTFASLP